jgi:hypothetical protein
MTYSTGTQARQHRPDALIVGAPKAGTTALHAALARHPQIYASPVKESKFYLCGEAPPPAFCGPGDAHSQQEWIWRRNDYEKLFADASNGQVRLESCPFYLYSADARRRISEELPDVKLIAVIRDPIDRAYSNWMHLWVDGLEPEADFLTACDAETKRIAAGWAPFWHYRQLGRYGEQLQDLTRRSDRERILVFRYRDLVSTPAQTLARVADFLRIDPSAVTSTPADNSRRFVGPGPKTWITGRALSAGAWLGQYAPPQVWRHASRPLLAARRLGGPQHRPELSIEQRQALLDQFDDDITLLEDITGEDFSDWRSATGRGSYQQRVDG